MERELEAAENRIAMLEQELARLSRRVGSRPPASQPAPERVSIDESQPNASPRALFKALKESYAEATLDLEIGNPATLSGRRAHTTYMRAVENWNKRIHREFKSPVVWTVRVIPLTHQLDETGALRVTAIDPETEVALGEPFSVQLNRATRHKLSQLAQRAELDVLVLRGTLIPWVAVNPDREVVGPFNNPPLIGPYAEFGFTVEASSLNLPQEEPQRPTTRGG